MIPRPLPEAATQDALLGKTVQVTPTDYGQVPSTGTLVYRDDNHIVVALANAGDAVVHVHFPADGFEVREAL